MSAARTSKPTPRANPYNTSRSAHPSPPLPSQPPPRIYRKIPIIVGGVLAFAFSASASFVYASVSKKPSTNPSLPAQDADVSDRYNNTAESFDQHVGSYEAYSFINHLRKQLARQAKGHVLEVSAGTGRNTKYYRLKQCKSLTLVDVSRPMLEIAEKKFGKSHPAYGSALFPRLRVAFVAQSTLEPLPASITKEVRGNGGYDTILQTMGLCSTPQPTKLLMHLGTLAHPERGRILLLEHGRSHYDWLNNILDKLARERADKQGCWWNRDIGRIVEESGLEVDKIRRKHFGTLWIVEARPCSSKEATEGTEKDGKPASEDAQS